MEIFSKNVVEVVEHINNEMLRVLEQTRVQVEQEVSNVISTAEATCKQFVLEADNTLTNIVDSTKQITDALVSKIEANSSTAISQLSSLSTATGSLISQARAQLDEHAAACVRAQDTVHSLQEQLCAALGRHAELEGRYLSDEYKVYSPTGKTPSRIEYRYPRMLAATSPHERLLARFRAMRHSHDEDCIVVESDAEPPAASDSENSSSEDSAVFAAPSPPLPSAARTHNNIVKSTSETDILYTMKKQQENAKENANRSVSSKKPSKLPAPSSHKKPLMERNA